MNQGKHSRLSGFTEQANRNTYSRNVSFKLVISRPADLQEALITWTECNSGYWTAGVTPTHLLPFGV